MPITSPEQIKESVWGALLATALLINLEPMRIGMIGFLLTKRRAIYLLIAFLCWGFLFNLIVGLSFIFVLNHFTITFSDQSVRVARLLLGTLLIGLGLSLCLKPRWPQLFTMSRQGAQTREGGLIQYSPIAAILMMSLPSVEFIALATLIHDTFTSTSERLSALVGFLLVSNMIFLAPILACILFPQAIHSIAEYGDSLSRLFRDRFTGYLLLILGVAILAVSIMT